MNVDFYIGIYKETLTPVPFGTVVNVSIFYCLFVPNKLLVKLLLEGIWLNEGINNTCIDGRAIKGT